MIIRREMMKLQLEGRTAVVTAASKGLGRAIAERLAEEGCRVLLCSRHGEAIRSAADNIRHKYGTFAQGFAVDLQDKEQIAAWIGQIRGQFAHIDALVCNAGGPPSGSFLELDDDQWERAIQTNLMSVVRLLRGFYPLMKDRGARVVTIASTSVKVPIPGLVLSNTLRTGINGLMKTLSQEWGPDGILLNTVCPGRIMTDRLEELDQAAALREGRTVEEIRERFRAQIPLGRYGEPRELADLSAYLLSPRNTYLTGSTFFVDGGMVKAL
jgi:3-oxoacyl-[acyl-carrier protein] reductase